MPEKKLTQEQMDAIAEMRGERGWSYQRISSALGGVSVGSIAWHCLTSGIESPKHETKVLPQTRPGPLVVKRGGHEVRAFTPEEDAHLTQMDAEGLTYSEMGRRLGGRKHNTVRGRLATLARQEARREAAESDR